LAASETKKWQLLSIEANFWRLQQRATVKKQALHPEKMGLFGPNSLLTNQLQMKIFFRGKPQESKHLAPAATG
jgi:hypothetical protein